MTFTPQDIVREIRTLAQERPDYVYEGVGDTSTCSYVTGADGGPGCLVGQALQRLGVPRETLAEVEGDIDLNGGLGVRRLLTALLGPVHLQRAVSWIERVQDAQDSGSRWHDAVASADVEVPL